MRSVWLVGAVALLWVGNVAAEEERVPGVAVFGSQKYVEYLPGDIPLVLSAPHGGALKPAEIPDRTYGVRSADANTQDLARRIAAEVSKVTGKRLPLIVSHLHRSKLDPNREIQEAAQGDAVAAKTWEEYHGFIAEALRAAVRRHGRAFFIDLHGQSHPEVRVELGYLHAPGDYAQSAEALNRPAFIEAGSLGRLMPLNPKLDYTALLSGADSLGALLEKRGFPATPSPRMPVPTEPYYRGGYTLARHVPGTPGVAGLQVEANRVRLRDNAETRQRFAEALVASLEIYLPRYLKVPLSGKATAEAE